MKAVDVCIVAARRPELLSEMLRSFSHQMLEHFAIKGAYANIDPVFGDEADLRECVRLLRAYLPMAEISTPAEPGFCRAVRENWRRTTAEYVVHLEDDWILNDPIEPLILEYFVDQEVAQIAFNTREKGLGNGEGVRFSSGRRWHRLFGISLFRYSIPIFTTSPCIIRGDFAREAASLLDIRLDPEKQFYGALNKDLERLAFKYRSLVYRLPDRYVITDIGRDWRDRRGIQKVVNDGVSTWTTTIS